MEKEQEKEATQRMLRHPEPDPCPASMTIVGTSRTIVAFHVAWRCDIKQTSRDKKCNNDMPSL
eukprot:7207585-Pyramimonas_sp.AAC.1